jgi:hypothetical protein
MDPKNQIKFVDNDGSVEVIPMTSRVHRPSVDRPVELDSIQEEISSAETEVVNTVDAVEAEVVNTVDAVEAEVTNTVDAVEAEVTNTVDAVEAEVTNTVDAVQAEVVNTVDAVEAEVVNTVDAVQAEVTNTVDAVEHSVKSLENMEKNIQEISKESLEVVSNAVLSIGNNTEVQIKPKGCCIVQ